jgi:hypothetical protein
MTTMPKKGTLERARAAQRAGKAPSTQAGEDVREEMEHIRQGKPGARSAKQARRAGVPLKPKRSTKPEARARARRDQPISPPPALGLDMRELPAYVSNGLIGLRVRPVPLLKGMALVSGYAGEHPQRRIEAAALAPYPLAGDVSIDGTWLTDVLHQIKDLRQSYDFSTAELKSTFSWTAGARQATCEILTFASREDPTLVCQELEIRVDGRCDLQVRTSVDATGIGGRALGHMREMPGEQTPCCDGVLLWESPGGFSRVGCAYVTEAVGGEESANRPELPPLSGECLTSTYRFSGRSAVRYRIRHIASVIPDALHKQPDQQARRMRS